MTSLTRTRRFVISAIVLAVAAVIVMMILTSRPTSSTMVGMDHGSGITPESSGVTPESSHSKTSSADMAGMDHGSGQTPESSHSTTSSGDMPGMDMPASTPTPTMAEDMPGMDHGSGEMPESGHGAGDTVEAAANRPLAPVLGAFGGGTSAVLITAGFLRRKDRAADRVKQAARAARRSPK